MSKVEISLNFICFATKSKQGTIYLLHEVRLVKAIATCFHFDLLRSPYLAEALFWFCVLAIVMNFYIQFSENHMNLVSCCYMVKNKSSLATG